MSDIKNEINFGTGNKVTETSINQGNTKEETKLNTDNPTKAADSSTRPDKWHKTWWGGLCLAVLAALISGAFFLLLKG